jgi:hypothetical protein
MDKPKPEFEMLAVVALDNAGINPGDWLQVARATADVANAGAAKAAPHNQSCLVEAYKDKIMYNIMIDLPNAGLVPPDSYLAVFPDTVAAQMHLQQQHHKQGDTTNKAIFYTSLQECDGQSNV